MRQRIVSWLFAQLRPHVVTLIAELLKEAEARLTAEAARRDAAPVARKRFIGE